MASDSAPLDVPLSNDFILPKIKDINAKLRADSESTVTYLCGNSLGPLSKRSSARIQEELDAWGSHAVVGHFTHPRGRPWTEFCDTVTPMLAELVGAKEKEVACMGTLTNNLHLMMDSFFKPTPERFKIICEARAFPSDRYAFRSQAIAHGYDPATTIVEVSPREGEYLLREEDIMDIIDKEGESAALVLFSGVQYYTGQWFPMQKITKRAKEKGCICGWDLAHAIGNVPLSLHDWDVDFAVWCTYKYLNAGPGGIAGLYIHEKWNEIERPKYAGWWGHDLSTRFDMPDDFSPVVGAQGFQQSNPNILAIAALLGSLELFKEAGMIPRLRSRSIQLTAALESMLMLSKYYIPLNEAEQNANRTGFMIITPSDPSARGAQLSLLFLPTGSGFMRKVYNALIDYGVIGDDREPDVIRLAPIPLYNTTKDCEEAVKYLDKAIEYVLTH